MIALKYEVVFEFNWISTHDNIFADALSRKGGEPAFHAFVRRDKPLMPHSTLVRHQDSSGVRAFGKEYSSDFTGDTVRRWQASSQVVAPSNSRRSVTALVCLQTGT